jgi:hypothetical protein
LTENQSEREREGERERKRKILIERNIKRVKKRGIDLEKLRESERERVVH